MNVRVLAVGEIVWDIIRGQEHIGGAPFNVAAHVAQLGGNASLLTRIGQDERGRRALHAMQRIGVDATFVQRDRQRATGWARAQLAADGSARFRLPRDPAYFHIGWTDALRRRVLAADFDALAFGTWAQSGRRTRDTLQAILRRATARIVLFDVNIRRNFYPRAVLHSSLEFSTVVKMNAAEVPLVAECLYGARLSEDRLAAQLLEEYPVRVVCVTQGAAGCAVHIRNRSRQLRAPAVRVVDTVGAGDAFSAAFLVSYCRDGDPLAAVHCGNQLGAYVAGQAGAVPAYDACIRRVLAP